MYPTSSSKECPCAYILAFLSQQVTAQSYLLLSVENLFSTSL